MEGILLLEGLEEEKRRRSRSIMLHVSLFVM